MSLACGAVGGTGYGTISGDIGMLNDLWSLDAFLVCPVSAVSGLPTSGTVVLPFLIPKPISARAKSHFPTHLICRLPVLSQPGGYKASAMESACTPCVRLFLSRHPSFSLPVSVWVPRSRKDTGPTRPALRIRPPAPPALRFAVPMPRFADQFVLQGVSCIAAMLRF